jgi:LysM repeat protein
VRKRTLSACVALAWSILIVPLLAVAGLTAAGHPAQAITSTAFTTRTALASAPGSTTPAPATDLAAVTLTTAATAGPADPAPGPVTWTVRPGDTLSGIAAVLAVPGGWPALYAANRQAIGPNPDAIRPGTVLTVPGPAKSARYTVTRGDTLSGIAAVLAVPGGWPALYGANRQAIGPNPDAIRPGTVLTVPGPASPAVAPARPAPARQATPAAAGAPARPGTAPTAATAPGRAKPPAARADADGARAPSGSMPKWLQDVLLAVGLLAATAFAAEPAAAFGRRRRAAPVPPVAPGRPGRQARLARRAAARAKIILAEYDRLIVTYCAADHIVYVLTPPGEDPRAVLRAARLVLPEDTYQDLAGHLGVPAAWPRE